MTFQISVPGSGFSFPCEPGETVLDAAERGGFSLPYSCRKGVCSSCEGGVVAGHASVRGKGGVTGPAEAVLLCQCRPTSDLAIAPKRIVRSEPPVRKALTATVYRITRPSEDVAVVQLRFPTGQRAKFRAGQYLRVLMPDGDSRNYSMANPPHESDGVQLHIRHVPGGRFSEGVLARLAAGDKLQVELPYGEFSLSERPETPAILLATGTGFAPIKSIVEDQIKRGGTRSLALYWGARRREDLYLASLAQKWAARAPWFAFTPVLSQPDGEWSGRAGYVHEAVLADHPDLSGAEVYACGNPDMVAAAQADFAAAGLRDDAFFSDPFVPSGEGEPVT
jgi:CDP-4-dehydro-6-deoxyglucose reductase/3-phenylpropionate/trans-cinnamate dioxygenase ferredoxin reductase subunit